MSIIGKQSIVYIYLIYVSLFQPIMFHFHHIPSLGSHLQYWLFIRGHQVIPRENVFMLYIHKFLFRFIKGKLDFLIFSHFVKRYFYLKSQNMFCQDENPHIPSRNLLGNPLNMYSFSIAFQHCLQGITSVLIKDAHNV